MNMWATQSTLEIVFKYQRENLPTKKTGLQAVNYVCICENGRQRVVGDVAFSGGVFMFCIEHTPAHMQRL